jgi:hypothetical protein
MKTPKPLEAGWNFSRAIFRASSPAAAAGRAIAPHGLKLGKACPMLKPLEQATNGLSCLIFDLELFDVSGLGLGGLDPFLHFRQCDDHVGILL